MSIAFSPLPPQNAPRSLAPPPVPAALAPAPPATPEPAAALKVKTAPEPEAKTKPSPEPAPRTEVKADPAPVAEPARPPALKSPAQLACERRKGLWSEAGANGASFCQTRTRDGGKSCTRSTQCEGYCLAKSNTCAPATPLLGCHDILNEDGKFLTQCIN